MAPGEAGDRGGDTLADARATIARQEGEIERLRARLSDERLAERLHEALTLASTTGAIAAPVTHEHLLEMIVDTAAHVLRARAAALFLLDEEGEELFFEVALGSKADEVRQFRVPLGHGVAGLVAATGQPIAVANAHDDPRVAADIAESAGYLPQTILCVPLLDRGHVIGVLELLDKEGGESFGAADIEALGLFANQAAVAVQQSRTRADLTSLLAAALESLGVGDGGDVDSTAREFTERATGGPGYGRSLELASLVNEVGRHGDAELDACRAILVSFLDYLRHKARLAGGSSSPR